MSKRELPSKELSRIFGAVSDGWRFSSLGTSSVLLTLPLTGEIKEYPFHELSNETSWYREMLLRFEKKHRAYSE
jgi:hypothetical protein